MELQDRKKLAKLMVIQDVSQRELAHLAGWKTHSYLGRLLRGGAKTLNAEPALRIAKALGVGVDDLFLTRVSVNPAHPDMKVRTKKVAA
ncbi:helix-turn-helix domain-containing protein [Kocuria sp. M1N1S27]|uniref:helix-turn-helix domain-containing protein n=1 Tax=Kocuria kalidii TaxID=3376283 RepID=UPI00379EDB54